MDPAENDPAITQLKRKHESAIEHLQQVQQQTNDKNQHERAKAAADAAGQAYYSALNKKKGPAPNQGSSMDLLRNWASGGSLSGK